MNYLGTVDFDATIHDYEFTRIARHQIFEVVSAENFDDMPADEIFQFLYKGISFVSFKDYLKRYLYERADIKEPFRDIDDRTWQDIISGAFEENNAPHSFEPASTRWTATVKGWLASERVRRSTVFLLGFGLRMTEEDVRDFLIKVLEEDDYHMDDPDEVIWRYCYRYGLNYAKARQLRSQYEKSAGDRVDEMKAEEILESEASLFRYLAGLKGKASGTLLKDKADICFRELFSQSKETIARIYNHDEEEKPEKERKNWTSDDIDAADLEKMLCSGIPMTESGNLVKANQSLLCRHFQNYRPSRQRIDGILNGRAHPDRYDLITITFFLHAQKEELTSEERLAGFLEAINTTLRACGMNEIHPANPYEAFILICILSDCPMAVYGDIWEMSYEQSQ